MGRVFAVTLVVLGAACNSPEKPTLTTVKAVTVEGLTAFTALNQTNQLAATATLSTDERVGVTDRVTWSTANPSIATVSSTGQLKSVDYGTTTVTASLETPDGAVAGTVQVQIAIVPTSLAIENKSDLTAVGQSIQLKAIATFQDGSTKDVTTLSTWLTTNSRVLTAGNPQGLVTAAGLGIADITARYTIAGKTVSKAVTIIVTPPGTFALIGRIRDPGTGGLDSVTIVHQPTGQSASSVGGGFGGGFTIGGLTDGTLSFSKVGYEAPLAEVTAASADLFFDVPMQPIIRFNAGEVKAGVMAPHDMDYVVGNTHCYPCNLVHIMPSPTGKFHIDVIWTETHTALKMWIGGTRYDGPSVGPGTISADVSPGNAELDVYIGQLSNVASNYVNFTIQTQIR